MSLGQPQNPDGAAGPGLARSRWGAVGSAARTGAQATLTAKHKRQVGLLATLSNARMFVLYTFEIVSGIASSLSTGACLLVLHEHGLCLWADDEDFVAGIMDLGSGLSNKSGEQFEHEFANRMEGWLQHKAQQEAAMRDRHQEQFSHLRSRLKGLEMEASIASAPVTALRRKQQSLLASKQYAEAFDHMKAIKRAEKAAMQAHREEQRRVNEETVRHLLEDQANEKENFKRSMRVEEDSLKEFKFKCVSSLSWGTGGKELPASVEPGSFNEHSNSPRGFTQEHTMRVPLDDVETFASSLRPSDGNIHWVGLGYEGEQQRHVRVHSNDATSASNPHHTAPAGATNVIRTGYPSVPPHVGSGSFPQNMVEDRAANSPLANDTHGTSNSVHHFLHDRSGNPTSSSAYSGGRWAVTTAETSHAQQDATSVPAYWMSSALAAPPEAVNRTSLEHNQSRTSIGTLHAPDNLRPIPTAWQANALNARPPSSFEGVHARGAGSDGGSLENAATVLLNAALTLVGRKEDYLPASGIGEYKWTSSTKTLMTTDQVPGQTLQTHDDTLIHPAAYGSSFVKGVDEPADGQWTAASKIKEGQTSRMETESSVNPSAQGSRAKRLLKNFGVASVLLGGGKTDNDPKSASDDDGDDDDAPLALSHAVPRGVSGRAVPGMDFSKMHALTVKPMTRANIMQPDSSPQLETGPIVDDTRGRGLHKFRSIGKKIENTSTLLAKGKEGNGGSKGHDKDEGTMQRGSAEETTTSQEKKVAAAKLLMRRAGNVPRLRGVVGEAQAPAIVSQEDAQPSQSQSQENLQAVEKHHSQQTNHALQAHRPSDGTVVQAKKMADRVEQESRMAENQKRQFTTDDFRNLFSYARHGKYKQVTELLKNGCPSEGRDQFGNTPMIIACQNGNARIVKALIRYSANIDSQNKQGCTGLHYCIAYGFNALSDYLIAKGANDKLLNKLGLSPYEGLR